MQHFCVRQKHGTRADLPSTANMLLSGLLLTHDESLLLTHHESLLLTHHESSLLLAHDESLLLTHHESLLLTHHESSLLPLFTSFPLLLPLAPSLDVGGLSGAGIKRMPAPWYLPPQGFPEGGAHQAHGVPA